MMKIRALALLYPTLAATMLGGCVLKHSRPARLYVLDALAAQGDASGPRGVPKALVGVLKVAVPGWIDRPEVTRRAGLGEIRTDEYARWGEPVGRGIQRVIVENLAALLPDRRLMAAPFAPNQVIDHRVEISIGEAARQADGSVLVDARWALIAIDGTTLVQRRSSHRAHPPGPGPAGTVAGASEALASLSREIAEALQALPASVKSE